ncbi:hypothetical protein FOZ63_006543 [Perkinsus olseni]|uniref:Uncharacterized protein n=1 Tax=Perkinsus olseni TaxID=32597 RepID=A0A7J6PBQ8_PEROL|nr:hypothetical protein FOZ60_013997 [Perkinsus olseni]KAF4693633.1 hypothetical protein FOZ63_006543 [Perkinsus olseni]KAF4745888.1 hypothetical protein FOZ62_027496 [Perkinsus olseni]
MDQGVSRTWEGVRLLLLMICSNDLSKMFDFYKGGFPPGGSVEFARVEGRAYNLRRGYCVSTTGVVR